MNPVIESYIKSMDYQSRIIKMRTEGITQEQSLLQLPIPANCMNWQLGHMLMYREYVLEALTEQDGPDPSEYKVYGAGCEQMTDGTHAVDIDVLKSRLDDVAAKLKPVLRQTSAEQYETIFNAEREMTLDDTVRLYLTYHEAYHIGQLEVLQELAKQTD